MHDDDIGHPAVPQVAAVAEAGVERRPKSLASACRADLAVHPRELPDLQHDAADAQPIVRPLQVGIVESSQCPKVLAVQQRRETHEGRDDRRRKLPAGVRHGRMFRIAARSHAHRIGAATARIPRAQ